MGGDGDNWALIDELQFRFLVERGLTPSDLLLDVGCGALRGGAKFIRYLDPDHYLGIDKHIELIIYGVANELGMESYREKRPRFAISDSFEFHKLGSKPNFAIAQSLFTHLSATDIELCLSNLRVAAREGCRFFATFFEASNPAEAPAVSHSHGFFSYTRLQMEDIGQRSGWTPNYIGDWNHPRSQNMIEYIARNLQDESGQTRIRRRRRPEVQHHDP